MPRGPRKEIVYTGKAIKAHEKVLKAEADLKAAKEELKAVLVEQKKEEKAAAAKAKKEAKQAAMKAKKEAKSSIMKAVEKSGKTPEEILAFLNGTEE